MARKVRIKYAGAVNHEMARGNQGRPVYPDDLDRKQVDANPAGMVFGRGRIARLLMRPEASGRPGGMVP